MTRQGIFFISFLSMLYSCSDLEPEVLPPREDNGSITIDPKEYFFDAIGQSYQFEAMVYDSAGNQVERSYSWMSSNEEVVAVRPNGIVESTGPGTAFVKVISGTLQDSAFVEVELAVEPVTWWINSRGGDWNDPENWNTGAIPSADDTIAITLEGNYEIFLTSDVSVRHLTFGGNTGEQILNTSTNMLTVEEGVVSDGANFHVDGSLVVNGPLDWESGDVQGDGSLEISNSGIITFENDNNQQSRLGVVVINQGIFRLNNGVRILIDDSSLDNQPGSEIDFHGDENSISILGNGRLDNQGDIIKSGGDGNSYFSKSSTGSIISSGYIAVETGILNMSDGEIDGVIDVAKDALYRQTGNTLLKSSIFTTGEGYIEIGSRIILGEQSGDQIRLKNVLLNSGISSGLSGPGDLTIEGSLLWKRGEIQDEGQIVIASGAKAELEGTGSKWISERQLLVLGDLETESLLDLNMHEGAELMVDINGTWTHTGSGRIRHGVGEQSQVIIYSSFVKRGSGSFTVGSDFVCHGQMELRDGALSVTGAFNLTSTGTLVGGSSTVDDNLDYRRLQVPEASSAVLSGTIDIDDEGEPAYLGILGSVTIEPTFTVLIEVDNYDPVPAERLVLETGGINLGGILEVSVLGAMPPPAGAEYRVVSTIDATGSFSEINGAEVFNSIQEDAMGVLLIR